MGDIFTNLKQNFKAGNILTKLIYINVGIFVLIRLLSVFLLLFNLSSISSLQYLQCPSSPELFLHRPWTIVTYMFTHFDFLHILFNMLWLYWFGKLFLTFWGERQLGGLYVWGGIAGAILFMLSYNIFPYFDATRDSAGAIGASASVMAIVFAVCTYLPNHKVYIFLLGPIKLIYLALFTACIDFFSIQFDNAGGHIAHLGGALFGWLFIKGLQHNKDFSAGITYLLQLFVKLFSSKKKVRVTYKKQASDMNDQEYNLYKKQQQETINTILDKISKSGYESLTREEKEILFKRKD